MNQRGTRYQTLNITSGRKQGRKQTEHGMKHGVTEAAVKSGTHTDHSQYLRTKYASRVCSCGWNLGKWCRFSRFHSSRWRG